MNVQQILFSFINQIQHMADFFLLNLTNNCLQVYIGSSTTITFYKSNILISFIVHVQVYLVKVYKILSFCET